MRNNLILQTDSYKVSHFQQYPPGTDHVYSYFESRGGEFEETVFFGLQYYLKEYLSKPVTWSDILEAKEMLSGHLSPEAMNLDGWKYINDKYNGYLPVRIWAVPEGSVHRTRTPLMAIENTDTTVAWLTNYLETMPVKVWYPSTVATLSREIKRDILGYLEATGDPSLIDFKLHDFGYRGASSEESARIGGCAHLLNFKGTDTIGALVLAKDYYKCNCAGFSISASEHSTITSWGKDHEVDAYRNMLQKYPTGLVACVSDSYDIYNACEKIWGEVLHDEVLARDGILVVRPDSGIPHVVVNRVLEILGSKFGFSVNQKGFKVLNPKIRVIQGDGVNKESIKEILGTMKRNGWSADNIAFGMGGALLQKLNRDTSMYAFKCSSVVVNGKERYVFKSPINQSWKASKGGRFDLPLVFENGKILVETTLDEARERCKI